VSARQARRAVPAHTAHQADNSSLFSSPFLPNAEILHHFYQLIIIFTNHSSFSPVQ